jgi:hypothetical protein
MNKDDHERPLTAGQVDRFARLSLLSNDPACLGKKRSIGPLLACPAGANVLQLMPPIPNFASPVGLPNRKENFT